MTYSLKSCKPLITFDLRSALILITSPCFSPSATTLADSSCQIPSEIRPSSSILAISSILNRKAPRQHSPLSGTLLDAKHFTLYLDWEAPDFIRDSL